MMLNFEGLTDEQVYEFIDSTMIYAEVDASYEVSPTTDGDIIESEVKEVQNTGWLSGTVLNLDLNNNIGLHPHDAIHEALRCYKEAEADMGAAQELFLSKYSVE